MKHIFLSCGAAVVLSLSAGAAMAGTLDPGLYNITFSGPGVASETDPVSIDGSGGARNLDIDAGAGAQTIHLTVSGASFTGSATLNGIVVTLSGSASGTGGSGTFHAAHGGRAGNGAFTLARRSGTAPRMMKTTAGGGSGSWWDSVCAWFGSFLDGSGAGAEGGAPPSGSGSTSHGLADYHPPR